jgi:hypothetical protein
MPFVGDIRAAGDAVGALRALDTQHGDELILADNSGLGVRAGGITVVVAYGERSPAHARNVGAAIAGAEWILFLDADCRFPCWLLDAYFVEPPAADVGALAGEVVPATDGTTLAERYGATRGFLSQEAHLAHPYRPRAVAANLLVRRSAFVQVGGFYEGVRAAEDTDFSWRLLQAGWRIELRPQARVEHRYRKTVSELRAQWRGYAAGRAWLGRRYEGFEPQPAVRRAAARVLHVPRRGRGRGLPSPSRSPSQSRLPVRSGPRLRSRSRLRLWGGGHGAARAGRLDRGRFLAIDAMLAAEELAGLTLSNRPVGSLRNGNSSARVVLVADRFPAPADPLSDFARRLEGARVEAAGRPDMVDIEAARALVLNYREDDGTAARAAAFARLVARHPLRCAIDAVRRRPEEPTLPALAPAVLRLARDRGARVHALGGDEVQATARRLAALAGRRLDHRRS